jgi:hypothetical protein
MKRRIAPTHRKREARVRIRHGLGIEEWKCRASCYPHLGWR